MDPLAKANALAELDAICDEFEQAFKQDPSIHLGNDSTILHAWVERVDPEMQAWLREELVALRQELQASLDIGSPSAPDGVEEECWWAVAKCETFEPLSRDAKVALAKSIQPQEFDRGSVLLASGKPTSGLHLILEGYVDVIGGEGDDRHLIAEDGMGSVLGEMSMLTGHPCSADVVATTPVTALLLPTAEFQVLRETHPEIEISLSQLVSDRLGHRSRDALCGKSLGGFRLDRCLSSGAMGVVYRGIDESDGTQRALKMMRHRFIYSPRVVSRFDQEAEFLRELEHPNIVSMRGHFIEYRTRFIVLDLYDGADLRRVLRRHGPVSESIARRLIGQVAAGLAHAHEKGVLHLDLKPANILINSDGHVAITDFGLGRLVEFDGVDQEVVGTPLYMPPEQFSMRNVGPHCDWYSFGCVLYELLFAERLFESNDTKQLRLRKLRPPSPDWPVSTEVSDDLSQHLRSALQPLVKNRELDLGKIARWAAPVPELVTTH